MTTGRILFFIFVVGSILASLHYYAWARLIRDPQIPYPGSSIAAWVIVLLGLSIVVALPASLTLPRATTRPIVWVAFTWMGLAFFLVVLLAAADLAQLAAAIVRRVTDAPALDPERRLFLHRVVAGIVALGSLALGLSGLHEGLKRVPVKRIRISLRRLRPSRVGYKIVQLSDIHVGPTIGREFIEQIVAQTNALKPDLIVITGDLVDGRVEDLREAVAPLANLSAKDGVFFVTGNHEYYSGVDEWLAHIATLGIRVLRNERVSIGAAPDGFDLAGVDDYSAASHGHGHGADLSRALAGRDKGRTLILLAHQPKQVIEASDNDVDLQLSGHTHGGQLFPFGWLVRLQQPYVGGFYSRGGTSLYVSRGTGYWGPPMRVGAPAEITQIELGMS